MTDSYDVVVAGLGAMGSAATYALARQGKRVLALDRFTPPHAFGSSHGATRIIRQAYFEHPLYVPLVGLAFERWRDLEERSGRSLLRKLPSLMIGPADGVLVAGARTSAETHDLPFEEISCREMRRRYPALRPPEEFVGILEPGSGILYPELCIETFIDQARELGAVLRYDEPVLEWSADGKGVEVRTEVGAYHAERLLLSSGAWILDLLGDLRLPLEVERNVFYWFTPRRHPASFSPGRCPIHVWEYAEGRFWYGFPDTGDGIKVALHHDGEVTSAANLRRDVEPREAEGMRRLLERYLPDAAGSLRGSAVCMYTNTPDGHFVIDTHPDHPQVVIASPCSGHGFKFSSVLGEILAALLIDDGPSPDFDLAPFRLDRLRHLD